MTEYKVFLVHSLEKVLPDQEPRELEAPDLYGFAGEALSVQIAYTCMNDDFGESDTSLRIEPSVSDAVQIHLRSVGLVPSNYPCHGITDDDYLSTRPGLYPDILIPIDDGEPLKAIPSQWRSVWVDIKAESGRHEIALKVLYEEGEIAELRLTVNVSEKELPRQTLIHTEWFHTDCLADYYHVPVFSDEHWRIIENYISSAVSHGVNALLTPIFTPPLDTGVGGERTTVQLVNITFNDPVYHFDFSLLEKWIDLCEKYGITYLEIAHLFSQWGAVYAPKIMVCINGRLERRFGWHTAATGNEYTEFLQSFLPALKDFLKRRAWLDKTIFHISDEPHMEEIETYRAARECVKPLLEGCRVMDAISSFDVFKEGVIDHPVVSVDHIHEFIDAEISPLWAYYCTIQAVDVPNRFMAMPGARNRIIGTLLYYYNLEGFLHWGFNFYNARRSVRHIDPYLVTDADESFPSGDAFLVYPAPDGTAYESLRGVVLKQALWDMRALQLYEQISSRDAVIALLDSLCEHKMSFTEYPRDITFFDLLRKQLYQLV